MRKREKISMRNSVKENKNQETDKNKEKQEDN